jgi:hypothetical protein
LSAQLPCTPSRAAAFSNFSCCYALMKADCRISIKDLSAWQMCNSAPFWNGPGILFLVQFGRFDADTGIVYDKLVTRHE